MKIFEIEDLDTINLNNPQPLEPSTKVPNKKNFAPPEESFRKVSGYDSKNPLHSTLARVFSRQRYDARRKGFEFLITPAYAFDVINKQQWRCNLSGVPFTPAGSRSSTQFSMDRIDSSKGYIPGNIQFTTLVVNLAKKNMTDANFIALCKQVADYNK